MIKELRAARWAAIAGAVVIALSVVTLLTTNLHHTTLQDLTNQSDADFGAVSSGHISTLGAAIWLAFYSDTILYLLVGLVSVLFGARLLASEAGSGSILLLLSRPISRERILLTKYGVCALLLLALCGLCGVGALVFGAAAGEAQPIGGVLLSTLLLWLATLFVLGGTLVYSVLIPSSLAAGVLGFFTVYLLSLAPLFHVHTPSIPGGIEWSLPTYWSNLSIYAGTTNPTQSIVVAGLAALIPLLIALFLFRRKAY